MERGSSANTLCDASRKPSEYAFIEIRDLAFKLYVRLLFSLMMDATKARFNESNGWSNQQC